MTDVGSRSPSESKGEFKGEGKGEFKHNARKRKAESQEVDDGAVMNVPSASGGSQSHVESDSQAVEEFAFQCKVDSTDVLTTLLTTLLIDKDQTVYCEVLPAGMKFTVDKSKSLKAKAYVKANVFQEFELRDNSVQFTVNLTALLHCLQVFGQSSHMQMTYAGQGSPVCLILEDEGVITQCELVTLDGGSPVDFNFASSPVASRAVIKSQFLKDSFAELDVPGGSNISIHMSPRAPFLCMFVKGDSSSCKVDFPMDKDADVFTEFDCKRECKQSYALTLIRPCIKALAKSEHTNLRMNEDGMLSMQHVIPVGDGLTNWVEFLICAREED